MTAIPVYESAGREQPRPAFGRCLYCLSLLRPWEFCRETTSLRTVGIQSSIDRDDGWIDIIAL